MLPYTEQDTITALRSAKNVNAAVKNFLKRDANGIATAAAYAKSLREAFESKQPQRLELFLKNAPKSAEGALLGVLRYAYNDGFTTIVERIAVKYAEEFEGTYARAGDGISVTDRPNFDRIVKDVLNGLDSGLTEQKIPVSNITKNVVLAFLFEPAVLKEVLLLLPAEK